MPAHRQAPGYRAACLAPKLRGALQHCLAPWWGWGEGASWPAHQSRFARPGGCAAWATSGSSHKRMWQQVARHQQKPTKKANATSSIKPMNMASGTPLAAMARAVTAKRPTSLLLYRTLDHTPLSCRNNGAPASSARRSCSRDSTRSALMSSTHVSKLSSVTKTRGRSRAKMLKSYSSSAHNTPSRTPKMKSFFNCPSTYRNHASWSCVTSAGFRASITARLEACVNSWKLPSPSTQMPGKRFRSTQAVTSDSSSREPV
mmetsp:Transcript_55635/g.178490  ORF Transcript_55635/g.178490 Transcript_55635/m.178490 type:complete len:259 (+) Transcript_55635:11-787(+)